MDGSSSVKGQRLSDVPVGRPVRVVRVACGDARRADRLAGLGVIAGSRIYVVQRRPAFVIEIGETTLALGEEIADEVYVVEE